MRFNIGDEVTWWIEVRGNRIERTGRIAAIAEAHEVVRVPTPRAFGRSMLEPADHDRYVIEVPKHSRRNPAIPGKPAIFAVPTAVVDRCMGRA